MKLLFRNRKARRERVLRKIDAMRAGKASRSMKGYGAPRSGLNMLALILAAGLGCSPAGPPREYFALRITNSVAQSVDLDAALIQSMKEGMAITNSLLLDLYWEWQAENGMITLETEVGTNVVISIVDFVWLNRDRAIQFRHWLKCQPYSTPDLIVPP